MVHLRRIAPFLSLLFVSLLLAVPGPAPTGKLILPSTTSAILDQIYEGRGDLALPAIHQIEQEQPDNPLGYLLEAEVEWWKMWCASAEFKYGMTMARHHEKAPGDQHYLELNAKAYSLAEAKFKQNDTGEMRLYAAMADALSARLYSMRGEYRASARTGVRGRSNFLAALSLNPTLSDAYTGLGLYNYYVDTLSALAKALRFLMGIPGGSKEEGIRQLERGMKEGQISASLARFYLAMNLFNYDQRYEEALAVITPLAEKYPQNAAFRLMQGDLCAKLGRKQQAESYYHAADTAADQASAAECRAKLKELVKQSMGALQKK